MEQGTWDLCEANLCETRPTYRAITQGTVDGLVQ
jgi:hypothetical protein